MSSAKIFSTYLKNQYEKRVLLHCYVDEKWLTNLDLQVFHLKKTSNARISLSLRQGNCRTARLSDGKKNYC